MDDIKFRAFFQGIVDRYELDPHVAAKLLQRILLFLENTEDKTLQSDAKYEILIERIEREELL